MEINYICSLGTLCHSSWYLKENKLKLCSYPFDWIISSPDSIIDCLNDDFSKFLDKSYYIKKRKSYCTHSYYSTKKFQNTRFIHHNPLENEKDYKYYERCVNRFRNLLKLKESKLFMVTLFRKSCIICGKVHNVNYNDKIKEKIFELNDTLKKYTSNFILLVIINYPNKEMNNFNFLEFENVHFLELYTLSKSNGKKFINDIDNEYLKNLINKKYNFTPLVI
tara:strand:- start:298 stop:963 length:666 start_codon:yes stop_codon:yes gene_type:complete